MKKITSLIGIALLTLFLASCRTIVPTGIVISDDREIKGFSHIRFRNFFGNVNIYPGADYKVTIITDDNIHNIISTRFNGDLLEIGIKNLNTTRYFSATQLQIDIHLPELNSIYSQGGTEQITIFDGNARDLSINLSGASSIDSKNYEVQNLTITNSGVGDARIWVTDVLLIRRLSSTGNIFYKGNPKINLNYSVGNIIPTL